MMEASDGYVCFRTDTSSDFYEHCIDPLAENYLHIGIKLGGNAVSYESVLWPGYKFIFSLIGDKIATK